MTTAEKLANALDELERLEKTFKQDPTTTLATDIVATKTVVGALAQRLEHEGKEQELQQQQELCRRLEADLHMIDAQLAEAHTKAEIGLSDALEATQHSATLSSRARQLEKQLEKMGGLKVPRDRSFWATRKELKAAYLNSALRNGSP